MKVESWETLLFVAVTVAEVGGRDDVSVPNGGDDRGRSLRWSGSRVSYAVDCTGEKRGK